MIDETGEIVVDPTQEMGGVDQKLVSKPNEVIANEVVESKFGGIPVEDSPPEELAASKFGGIPIEPASKFGGIPVDINAPIPIQPGDFQRVNQNVLNNVVTVNSKDLEGKQVAEDGERERLAMQDLAYERFPAEIVDNWKESPIDFWEADDFYDWSAVVPLGGLVEGGKALKILNISQKVEAGEEITPSENEMFTEFVDRQLEMNVRGMTFGAKFRYYGAPLPAFMTEFLMTGGVGKAAQASVTKAASEFAKRSALAAATTTTVGRVARVAAQSAAMVPMTVGNYGDIRLGGFNVTDKGQILFREAKESPAISALRAFGYTAAEVASELSGATIAKYLINPVAGKLKTPLIGAMNQLPETLKSGLYQAYKKIKPNATISKVFTNAGWNGMLAELGEERVADVLRETVNLTLNEGYTFDQVLEGITPSKEQLLLEASLIGTVGSVKTTAEVVTNRLMGKGKISKETQEIINNLLVSEQQAFIDNELQVETEAEAVAREVLESETLQAEVEDEARTGKQVIKQASLNAYEEFKQGTVDTLVKVREKAVKELKRQRNVLMKNNPKVAKIIAAAGGINVQSIVEELGFDKADLMAINKAAGQTVFRVKGGSAFDDIDYQALELPYFDSVVETDGFLSPENLVGFIEQLIANPKLAVNAETQLQIDEYNQEIEMQEDMGDIDLQNFYENIEVQSDPVAELGVLERTPLAELENVIDEYYPTMTAADLEAAVNDAREFESLEGDFQFPVIDEVVQTQTEAALIGQQEAVAPSESIFRNTYYDWLDQLGALGDLSLEAQRRGLETPDGENLNLLYRMYAGVAGMSTQLVVANTYKMNQDGAVEITGNGLKPILEDFDNLTMIVEQDRAVRELDLKEYLVARRYIYDLEGIEEVEVTEEQKIASAVVLDRIAQKYGEKMIWFDSTANEIYAYQTRVLEMLVASGVMSQETFKEMTTTHSNYIPFQRVLDEEYGEYGSSYNNQLFNNATLSRVVKKIIGSDKKVKDPIQSIIKNTFRIADIAWQNRVARSIASLADVVPEYIEKVKMPMDKIVQSDGTTTYRPSKIIPKDLLVVSVEGKKQFYKIDPAIKKALDQMQPPQISFLEKFFSMPASILRAGATIAPDFWIANFFRDNFSALIQSEGRPIPFVDPIRGLASIMGNGELYQQWMKSGGSFNSYMELTDNGVAKAQKELLKPEGRIARYLKNPLRAPSEAGLAVEQSVRIGVFAAAKRQGKSDLAAALESRDATLDFSRGGSIPKKINRYIPFFNVGMQGADKLYRTFKERPKATSMWALSTITLPSIMITGYYLYGASDEDKQEYLEIPQWQKDIYWVYKIDGEWKATPKPFSLGFIFGSVPERFMNWMASEGKEEGYDFWIGLVKGMATSVSPVYSVTALFPPALKVYAESISNYNFFRGRSVYPEWLDDLPPEDRVTAGTSETAKEVGKLLDVSPALLDNALRGTIASSAKYVTTAGDFIINETKKWNGELVPEDPDDISDNIIMSRFRIRQPMSESIEAFYELSNQVTMVKNKLNRLKGEERAEYRQENNIIIDNITFVQKGVKQIGEINKRIARVREDKTMNSADKADKIKQLNERKLQIATSRNERFLRYIRELAVFQDAEKEVQE